MPGNPLTDQNWARDVTEQITTVVGNVRDKTTNNAVSIVKGVVFAFLGLFLAIVAIVLLLVMLTRFVQSVVFDPWLEWDKAVWASYFLIGGILSAVGLFLMSRRPGA